MRTNFHSTNEIAGKLFVQLWNYTKILYLIIFKSLSWISRLTFCFFNRRPSTGPCGNGTDFVPKGLFYCSQLPSFLHCKILQEKKIKHSATGFWLLNVKLQTSGSHISRRWPDVWGFQSTFFRASRQFLCLSIPSRFLCFSF